MSNSTTAGEFRRIMENADPLKITSTLMYDPETDGKKLDDWEFRIEDEFYKTFGKISAMLPDGFDHMDDLRTAIYNMANVHDEIYFHLGMLYGFNLYRSFYDEYAGNSRNRYSGVTGNTELMKSLETIQKRTRELTDQVEEFIHKLSGQ